MQSERKRGQQQKKAQGQTDDMHIKFRYFLCSHAGIRLPRCLAFEQDVRKTVHGQISRTLKEIATARKEIATTRNIP